MLLNKVSAPAALIRRFGRPLRFALVGASGVGVNTIALLVLVQQFHIPVLIASILATELAILSNFLLNNYWTFRTRSTQTALRVRLLRFNVAMLGGMAITVLLLGILTAATTLPLMLANAIAVSCAMVWNYLSSNRWVWMTSTEAEPQKANVTGNKGQILFVDFSAFSDRGHHMTMLMEGQAPREGTHRINTEMVLVIALCVCIAGIRLASLDYNTAFVDEAIYLMVGQRVLEGNARDNALQWMSGSYLYPMAVAFAEQRLAIGLSGARLFSVLVAGLAVPAVYGVTRRLFNPQSALLATMIFGFAGVSVYTSTLATYDSLGIGMLGLSALCLTYVLTGQRGTTPILLALVGALCFTLSVLSKYIALAWLLPVGGLGLLLLLGRQRHGLAVLTGAFGLPIVVLLAGYVAWNWDDLSIFVTQFSALTGQPTTRLEIIEHISFTLRFPLVLALVSLIPLIRRREPGLLCSCLVLWMAALVMPLYHLAGANARSIDKSMAYALIFLAPLAGHGLLIILQAMKGAPGRQAVALSFTTVYLFIGLQIWEGQTWQLRQSWPNIEATLTYLQQLPTTPETRVLAEGGYLYDYHLDWGRRTQLVTTWDQQFTYAGTTGDAAMLTAIADQHFDYLIVDRYFTPILSELLVATAQANGYERVFSDETRVSGSEERTLRIEVYAPRPGG